MGNDTRGRRIWVGLSPQHDLPDDFGSSGKVVSVPAR